MFNDHLGAGHWSHMVAAGWAVAGPPLFAVLLAAGWWAARRRPASVMAAAIWAPVGAVTALLVNQPLERTTAVRPPFLHGLPIGTVALPEPSDHATLAAATAAGLFFVRRRLGLLASAAAVTMALAFVAAGAPPEDVAGGAVVGATVTLIGFVLLEGPIARLVARSRRTRLRALTGAGRGVLMGLTSGPFIVALALVAVVAFVACVRLLPRVAGHGPRQVLARTGLVTGTQLVVVFAVLVAVNSSFEFFGSWSDLLGTDNSQVHVVGGPDRAAPPAAAAVPSLRPAHDALSLSVPATEGRLEAVVVHGPRTGLTATAYVYLPPQYTRPAYRHRNLPVVLVLTADPRGAITRLRLPDVVTAQVAAGAVPPAVYVLMSPPAVCVDVPGGRQGETFLSQDVPMAVTASYRVATDGPGWAVLGDSSGGYCAAKLALAHSDRFAAGVAAAYAYGAPPGNLYGGSPAIRQENDLTWRLRHRTPPPADLLVLADRAGAVAARNLAALTRPPTYAQVLDLTGGGALPTWRRDLPAVLRWLGQRLNPGS